MTQAHRHFIPAASHDFLLPLYDPLVRLVMRDDRTRGELVRRAALRDGDRALDLGCGTGSLAMSIQRQHPGVQLSALDPDPKALALARGKAEHAGFAIRFEQGFGDALPFADASFDRVLSSLVLHHLTHDEKLATLRDVRRVLRPGGSVHVLDFGPPEGRLDLWLTHVIHRGVRMEDNLEGRLPELMRAAGFADAQQSASVRTALGRLAIVEARRA